MQQCSRDISSSVSGEKKRRWSHDHDFYFLVWLVWPWSGDQAAKLMMRGGGGGGVLLVQQAGLQGRCSSGPQQTVNSLQLTLWQDEAVDLLLTAGTRHHDPTHQHRVGLLLLLRLKTGKSSVLDQLGEGRVWWVPRVLSHYPSSMNSQENKEMMSSDSLSVAALTLTNVVEGNVAKSDDTRAPGWWLTTCSATSSWQRRDGEEDILI